MVNVYVNVYKRCEEDGGRSFPASGVAIHGRDGQTKRMLECEAVVLVSRVEVLRAVDRKSSGDLGGFVPQRPEGYRGGHACWTVSGKALQDPLLRAFPV
jgi:hypothetical protein